MHNWLAEQRYPLLFRRHLDLFLPCLNAPCLKLKTPREQHGWMLIHISMWKARCAYFFTRRTPECLSLGGKLYVRTHVTSTLSEWTRDALVCSNILTRNSPNNVNINNWNVYVRAEHFHSFEFQCKFYCPANLQQSNQVPQVRP